MELSEEQQRGMVEARKRVVAEVAAVVQDRSRVVSALSASTLLPLPAAIPGSSQQACLLASCPGPFPPNSPLPHSPRPQTLTLNPKPPLWRLVPWRTIEPSIERCPLAHDAGW